MYFYLKATEVNNYIQDEQFQGLDFKENPVPPTEYENCIFINCSFAGASLGKLSFMECEFENCNFSSAKIAGTGFKEVVFRNCKLLGLAFDTCSDFLLSFRFSDSILNFSSFYRLKIPNTSFSNCRLQEVDFTEAELSGVNFSGSDLSGAIFQGSRLSNSDFRGAVNYSINPQENVLTGAKFAIPEVVGLLDVYKIRVE